MDALVDVGLTAIEGGLLESVCNEVGVEVASFFALRLRGAGPFRLALALVVAGVDVGLEVGLGADLDLDFGLDSDFALAFNTDFDFDPDFALGSDTDFDFALVPDSGIGSRFGSGVDLEVDVKVDSEGFICSGTTSSGV